VDHLLQQSLFQIEEYIEVGPFGSLHERDLLVFETDLFKALQSFGLVLVIEVLLADSDGLLDETVPLLL
jgi:hypothetical protein